MNLKASEIIEILGGAIKVAEILHIKPPSVYEWKKRNVIPEGRLAYLAPFLERKDKRFSRKKLFPNDYKVRWPELND